MPYQVWWYRVFDKLLDMRFKPPVTMPIAHVGPVAIMRSQMISTLLPGRKTRWTESTSRFDLIHSTLPSIHRWIKLGFMDQPQVLSEMIFSVEGSLLLCLLLTSRIVMSLEMFLGRIELRTECTLAPSSLWRVKYSTNWTTDPALQSEMQ